MSSLGQMYTHITVLPHVQLQSLLDILDSFGHISSLDCLGQVNFFLGVLLTVSMAYLLSALIISTGYQFDYVFDWTILKYPQIGANSRSRVRLASKYDSMFDIFMSYHLCYFYFPDAQWKNRNKHGTICRKTRQDFRCSFFPLKLY